MKGNLRENCWHADSAHLKAGWALISEYLWLLWRSVSVTVNVWVSTSFYAGVCICSLPCVHTNWKWKMKETRWESRPPPSGSFDYFRVFEKEHLSHDVLFPSLYPIHHCNSPSYLQSTPPNREPFSQLTASNLVILPSRRNAIVYT